MQQHSIHLPLSDDVPTSTLISEFRACPSDGEIVIDVRQGGVATEGFILSPIQALQHPMNCTYVIISRTNERIRLEFFEFLLHSGNSQVTEDNHKYLINFCVIVLLLSLYFIINYLIYFILLIMFICFQAYI